jgi:hypothetical protein
MNKLTKTFSYSLLILALISCDDANNEDVSPTGNSAPTDEGSLTDSVSSCDSTIHTCVTVGVYKFENNDYVDLNKDLIYTVGANCETWTRTAPADDVNSESHLHYNAQNGSTYVDGVFTWYEYGPEHDQDSINTTCANGDNAVDGVEKSISTTVYHAQGNFHLKIKSVAPSE